MHKYCEVHTDCDAQWRRLDLEAMYPWLVMVDMLQRPTQRCLCIPPMTRPMISPGTTAKATPAAKLGVGEEVWHPIYTQNACVSWWNILLIPSFFLLVAMPNQLSHGINQDHRAVNSCAWQQSEIIGRLFPAQISTIDCGGSILYNGETSHPFRCCFEGKGSRM